MDDETPLDDSCDFDLRFRQLQIRKDAEMKRIMGVLAGQINASLQSTRNTMRFVDEKTRRPL